MYKLEDIKSGYLLVVGEYGETYNLTVGHGTGGKLGCTSEERWFPLAEFNDKLEYSGIIIEEIYSYTSNRQMLSNLTDDRELLWKRPSQKYTLSIPSQYEMALPEERKDYLVKFGKEGYFQQCARRADIEDDYLFTQEEIDALPNQDFIKSLDKIPY